VFGCFLTGLWTLGQEFAYGGTSGWLARSSSASCWCSGPVWSCPVANPAPGGLIEASKCAIVVPDGASCHLRVVSDEAFLLESHSLSLRLCHDWSGVLLSVRLLLGGFAFGAGIAMFPDQVLRAILPRLCVRGGRVRFIPRCSVWKSSVLRYGFNSSQS
jgi:hypothetical protein